MHFIDTHIHLQDYKSKNAPQVIAGAQMAGACKMFCVSAQEGDWPAVAELAEAYPQCVIPAFGVHPWYLHQTAPDWEQRLREMLRRFPQALIGECGLDRLKNSAPEPQQEIFAKHIALAKELNRPLLVHAVKAQDWLESFWLQLQEVRFILHSFGGSVEFLKRALSFGAYISFAPTVRRRSDFAALAVAVPANRLLLESDGPYQGDPKEIPTLAAEIAALRNLSPSELATQIEHNAEEFIHV